MNTQNPNSIATQVKAFMFANPKADNSTLYENFGDVAHNTLRHYRSRHILSLKPQKAKSTAKAKVTKAKVVAKAKVTPKTKADPVIPVDAISALETKVAKLTEELQSKSIIDPNAPVTDLVASIIHDKRVVIQGKLDILGKELVDLDILESTVNEKVEALSIS